MLPRTPTLQALIFITVALAFQQASAQEWRLFGRHGECAPISSLKRKLPDMPEVRTPEEFSAYLDLKRLKFTRQTHPSTGSGAVEFQVSDAGLAVLFVPHQFCDKSLQPPR